MGELVRDDDGPDDGAHDQFGAEDLADQSPPWDLGD